MQKDIIMGTEYWERCVNSTTPAFKLWIKKENLAISKIILKNSVILDLGFGTGRSIREIAGIAKIIMGIDFNKSVFRDTKKNLSLFKNVRLFNENANNLHFKDNIFDYIICLGNTFGNFGKERIKILKEVKRVLKRNGKFLVSIYSEKALPERLKIYKKVGMKFKVLDKNGKLVTEDGISTEQFSKDELRKIFDNAEFKVKITNLTPITYLCEALKKVPT
jgi:ubiquinone/menaquinone biosynthesis C-methylase UbiE